MSNATLYQKSCKMLHKLIIHYTENLRENQPHYDKQCRDCRDTILIFFAHFKFSHFLTLTFVTI